MIGIEPHDEGQIAVDRDIRQYLYEALEAPSHGTFAGLVLSRFLSALIVASLTLAIEVSHLH